MFYGIFRNTHTMSSHLQLIFVAVIVAVLVIECESLQCYTYILGSAQVTATCVSAKYCVNVVDLKTGSCDDETPSVCTTSGCNSTTGMTVCCCNKNLCNSGSFVQSTMSATALSIILFVIVSRFIVN